MATPAAVPREWRAGARTHHPERDLKGGVTSPAARIPPRSCPARATIAQTIHRLRHANLGRDCPAGRSGLRLHSCSAVSPSTTIPPGRRPPAPRWTAAGPRHSPARQREWARGLSRQDSSIQDLHAAKYRLSATIFRVHLNRRPLAGTEERRLPGMNRARYRPEKPTSPRSGADCDAKIEDSGTCHREQRPQPGQPLGDFSNEPLPAMTPKSTSRTLSASQRLTGAESA